MSGWLLMVGLLAVAAAVWFILSDRRGAQTRRLQTRGRRPDARGGRPRRRAASRRAAADTEFASETLPLPNGSREGDLGDADDETGRAQTRARSPWGNVAVPTWEHPIPWSYGETRLTALVRDPYWIFAYWEITGETQRLAEKAVGPEAWSAARPILRVHDASGRAHYDVAIEEEVRNWYLNVGQPDRAWYLEIGRLTRSGRFVMLARSNTVHTPRDGPSQVIDPRWPPQGRAAHGAGALQASPGFGLPSSPGVTGIDDEDAIDAGTGRRSHR
jgi:hypothetical protein